MPARNTPRTVDVVVVGGGPTSLITSFILAKNGVDVMIVEQYEREEQAMYGRACVLYPRSLELLDLNGLYEHMADMGFIIRDSVTINDGKVVPGRGWHFVQDVINGHCCLDFCLNLRQKYVEDAVKGALDQVNPKIFNAPVKFLNYTVDNSGTFPVTSTLHLQSGEFIHVRSKYLLGADGGRSTVRSLSMIGFPGTMSPHKWVRLDAVVKTDMPCSRMTATAIESQEHGNVLWLPVDHGRTRIGFVFPDELYGEEGKGVTVDMVMEEAKKALRPNSLEFVTLDWWTVYAIGQRVAEKFRDGPVLLVGDAAHTHSSGSAQGMNTGIHDSTNLAWKLAGVIKGWYKEDVLDTYSTERRASAQRLIELDRDVAALISGKIPDRFQAPPGSDANEYLDRVFRESAGFTVGLGISYAKNVLNRAHAWERQPTSVPVGHRAPDARVYRHGSPVPRRLYELAASYGRRFTLLVFAGEVQPEGDATRLNRPCAEKYRALRHYMDSPGAFSRNLADVFQLLTILRGEGTLQVSETLGALPLGRAVHDLSGEAYAQYGVDAREGALVALRPDGIVGCVAPLDGWTALANYFGEFVHPAVQRAQKAVKKDVSFAVGELSVEGQEETHAVLQRSK